MVCEPRWIADVRLTGDGSKDHQVARTDQLLGAVMYSDPASGPRPLQVAAESGHTVGGQVMHADLVERPAGSGQEGMDVAGDQAHPEESDTRRAPPVAAEPVSRRGCQGSRPGGTDDRAFQAGERVAGVVVVEDQHG